MPILKHEERLGAVLAGRFRLDAILGRGGMGVVFKGEALESGRPVAVKLLNYEYAERPEVVSRFIREANMLRDLEHPNIVGVYDLGQDTEGTVYLVLEFLDGQSLGDRLTELGVLGVVEAADVLLPVMDALSFAHARGVVHRDLKPDNIYVTRDDSGKLVPKLLDFGIAKTLDKDSTALTQTGFVLGTPEYMSPEQAQGSGVGAAADIYSMGVVFYECLSGTLPTGDLEGTAILVATATGRTTSLAERAPWLPKAVVDVVQRALRLNPAERFADMREFAAAMAQACGIVRKSGEIRPPEGIAARRKTQMGLRDPRLKASSPSLVEFHQANAYELGPMAGAAQPVPAKPSQSSSSRGVNWLVVAGAAAGLLALGAGGAYAFSHRTTSSTVATAPTTEPVLASHAEDAAVSAPIAQPTAVEDAGAAVAASADNAVTASGAGRPRVRAGANSAQTTAQNGSPTNATTPATTPTVIAPQQSATAPTAGSTPSNPTTTTTRTPSNGSGSGRTTPVAGPNNPLLNYEE